MRTNTQVTISFGRDEYQLLEMLDEGRKREHINRSAWIKNQIREKFGNHSSSTQNLYSSF
tara:strand:+ start:1970 stop:2149 length:180 start_codon:yes stop_codon:yes gene_type:complete